MEDACMCVLYHARPTTVVSQNVHIYVIIHVRLVCVFCVCVILCVCVHVYVPVCVRACVCVCVCSGQQDLTCSLAGKDVLLRLCEYCQR